ncbi:MAG: hypothetical protein Q8N44_04960, partial [Rubrivivax sp.]|nr:hypothetical protein [Rubrivivax sp.]
APTAALPDRVQQILQPAADKLTQILQALPELARGDLVELRVAAQRLREAGLLSRSGVSTKLFGQFGDRFELVPDKQPNAVRLRRAGA